MTIPISWKMYPGSPPPIVSADNAPWVSTPTKEDVIAAFPAAAAGKAARGRVVMQCTISILGLADGCKASSAEPAGLGFEEAAVQLAAKFKADADWRTRPKRDIDVQIKIPVQFARVDDPIWSPPDFGKIAWLKTADPDVVHSLFPKDALKAGLFSGSATVDCVVGKSGALTGCMSKSETPQNLGFGQAAAEIAQQFVMNPWTSTGLPADGAHVQLPIQMVYGDKGQAPNPAPKP